MMWRRTFAAVAKPEIIKMGAYDENNSDYQKTNFVLLKKLFQHQEDESDAKN